MYHYVKLIATLEGLPQRSIPGRSTITRVGRRRGIRGHLFCTYRIEYLKHDQNAELDVKLSFDSWQKRLSINLNIHVESMLFR